MKRDIRTYEEHFAWKLVVDDDRCQGVITWDLVNGGLMSIGAKTVILATGGAGRLYTGTTNAYACTGDGMALALRAGVPLKDMEMMQFHPTTLAPTGVLITEGCRGEGAYLLVRRRASAFSSTTRRMRWSSRRATSSRAEQTEIDEGRGVDGNVLLDLRHLGAERILERLHGTLALDDVRGRGSDLRADPRPAEGALPHGRRGHGRLGPHDADRALRGGRGRLCLSPTGDLGGNALMETITYGNAWGRTRPTGPCRIRP